VRCRCACRCASGVVRMMSALLSSLWAGISGKPPCTLGRPAAAIPSPQGHLALLPPQRRANRTHWPAARIWQQPHNAGPTTPSCGSNALGRACGTAPTRYAPPAPRTWVRTAPDGMCTSGIARSCLSHAWCCLPNQQALNVDRSTPSPHRVSPQSRSARPGQQPAR
jgi:hypothetical protein